MHVFELGKYRQCMCLLQQIHGMHDFHLGDEGVPCAQVMRKQDKQIDATRRVARTNAHAQNNNRKERANDQISMRESIAYRNGDGIAIITNANR